MQKQRPADHRAGEEQIKMNKQVVFEVVLKSQGVPDRLEDDEGAKIQLTIKSIVHPKTDEVPPPRLRQRRTLGPWSFKVGHCEA